jgi:RNA polymerase sigma factor (sigma-70 family)
MPLATAAIQSTGELASAAEAYVVQLARLGDSSAFAELVSRRQSWIRNLLRRLSRDPTLADDLSQEAFLQAWKQLNKLEHAAAFGGWLRQIAVNTWLQHVRKSESFSELQENDAADSSNITAQIDLDTALATLPAPVRLCIVLNYHENLSHAEIAAFTRLPIGTVKSHIARGATRLRELLSDYAASPNTRQRA